MPIETQLVVAGFVLVFAFFMVMLAWAERHAGGRFDDETEARIEPSRTALDTAAHAQPDDLRRAA